MGIYFNEATKQFYLHTRSTSYVMELYEGCLATSYWGRHLEEVPALDEQYPFRFGADFSATDLPGSQFFSTDKLPQEYPTYGSADLRSPALHGHNATGDGVTRLRYENHRIFEGKPALPGLPATYGDNCQSLEITLTDAFSGIATILCYTVFQELDVLTRSVRIENRGNQSFTLEKAMSFSLDLHENGYEIIHLPGRWARERHIERVPVSHGTYLVDSKRGASSHNENPFLALVQPRTNEETGDAYGFCLVYSGSFSGEVTSDQFDSTRVQMGIQPFDFSWEIAPGESFQTPEAIMVYSANGLGEMSRRFHRIIRDHLCRGNFRDTERPVLINNWEATYFNFNEEKILALAAQAKAIGVELLVLDDGWFGKRDADNCSLGDWVVDRRKLPNGLESLCKKINRLGLQFGLWLEPEMVSPNSDLYRSHPDWCIHVPGRSRTEGRRQLILDLSRQEVCDYVIDAVSQVLKSCPICYVKWDMNRNMTEMPAKGYAHRYILGLYRVLEALTNRFPDVLFESCSGGGGRFDAGMLYYMPQTWTSDDTDAVERLFIQEGTSLAYPLSAMGAHISAVPNHQVGRVSPIDLRSKVAMMGRYGLELDLGKLSQEELDFLAREIALYKTYQQVIHRGSFYRIASPYADRFAAYQVVSQDEKTVMLFLISITANPNQPPVWFHMQGLDPDGSYKNTATGRSYKGSTLMYAGVPCTRRGDKEAELLIFQKQ